VYRGAPEEISGVTEDGQLVLRPLSVCTAAERERGREGGREGEWCYFGGGDV